MKLAYIILAHKNPEQLLRLINKLNSADVAFFVHIDKTVNSKLFTNLVPKELVNKVQFVKREVSRWGSVGIVKATMNGIKAVLDHPTKFDYLILLSGQDYPLKSNASIHSFFEQNFSKNFIQYYHLQEPSNWMPRLKVYHLHFFGKHIAYPSPSKNIKRKIMDMMLLLPLRFPSKREFPSYLKPYGGSQWWCITHEAAKYILTFIDQHPDFMKYHTYSLCSDETFFQTILLNSSNEKLLESIVNDNLKFIDWSRPKPRPAIFTYKDFSLLTNSDKLFARKFDTNIDNRILDMLDNES